MTKSLPQALLWLFVINLGIAFGAGLYEGQIVVSNWLISTETGFHWDAEAARHDNTGLRFWAFVTTLPLTLLTVANLIAAWRAAKPVRQWWLGAGAVAFADRVFTFAYFIPTMVGLMEAQNSPESVATALQWTDLNYVRHALILAAWLAALKAFALMYQQRK